MGSVSTASVDVGWLDWLAEQAQAKVEVDIEGSIIVTPASNPHVVAVAQLLRQVVAVAPPELLVAPEGPRWAPLGGDKPSYVPDLTVVEARAVSLDTEDFALDPPPLLVVEVISPESRRRDLQEKVEAYFVGGAFAYWTVEVPRLSPLDTPELTIRRRGAGGWVTEQPVHGVVDIGAPFAVQLDLSRLAP